MGSTIKKIPYGEFLKNYFGSGNPKDSFWFIGMEWAGWDWDKMDIPFEESIRNFNGDWNIQCNGDREKSMFGNIGIIVKRLGLANNNMIINDGIEKVVFKSDGDLFFTNTSLLAFPKEGNDSRNKSIIEIYRKYIDGLDGLDYYSIFRNPEYHSIRKATFQELIKQKPKFIFCVGNAENFRRLFSLLDIPVDTLPVDKIKVHYYSRGKFSEVWFYNYNNLKIAVCPFFSKRWYKAEEDLQKICDKVKEMI